MSKIVCDICGTSYDDANGGCPVCGWGQNGELPTGDVDLDEDFLNEIQDDNIPAAPAAPVIPEKPAAKVTLDTDAVKGRRRPAAKPVKPAKPEPKKVLDDDDDDDDDDDEEESGSNAFLVIILVLLILALLAVSAYIGWTKILKPRQMGSEDNAPKETITAQVMDPTQDTTAAAIVTEPVVTEESVSAVPCTNISLSGSVDTLLIGQYWRLMAKTTPENTTDKVVYSSSNNSVLSIDEYGRVTAVGAGEAVITVTCGSQHLETTVVVKSSELEAITPATTAPSAPVEGTSGTIPATTDANTNVASPSSTFSLRKHDITLYKLGTYFTMPIDGGITADSIKWSTSDSSIANVYNGVITCTGRGVCVITAEYNGQTEQCVVRCKF